MSLLYFKVFKVEAWLDKYEPEAKLHLGETSIAPLTLRELKETVDFSWEEIENIKLDYGEIQGIYKLRSEIANMYPNTSPEEVLITNGSIEANFIAMAALSEECESFLAEHPGYNQLYELPQAFGKEIKLYKLRREKGFKVDVDELLKEAENIDTVILNHPHNPTGASLEEESMREIIESLTRTGKRVLIDQTYLWLSRGEPITPPARLFSSEVIMTGSLSKTFGLPGLRIGWIVGPRSFIERCWKIRDYLAISVSPVTQTLAYHALRGREKILKRTREILSRNFDILSKWMIKNEDLLSWIPPSEGCVAFPWLKGDINSETFCKALLEKEGVLLVPGTCFELPDHLRIGFGFETETLIRGLEAMENFLRRNR